MGADNHGVPTLSLVVPATDRPPTLARCLAAVALCDHPPDEVIVVESPAGALPAVARNAGAAEAHGEVLVFVDADVEVHADAFALIRERFANDGGLAALFGSYDDDPAEPDLVSTFRNLLHHYVHQSSPGPATTFWTGLGAIRAAVFTGAGGFRVDPFPLATMEDVELGMRLAASGFRIELDPDIQGRHLKRWTLGRMVWTDLAHRGVPWVILLLQEGRTSRALNLGWRHRLGAILSLVAAVALARRRPVVATAAASGLVALNRPFYALLARRLGLPGAAAGVALHAIHHLTAIAAVPAGALAALLERVGLEPEAGGLTQPASDTSESASSAAPSSR